MMLSKKPGTIALLLAMGMLLGGCETFLKKFRRESDQPQARPTPIFRYQNYGEDMTPEERYQKAYGEFDFWQERLLSSVRKGSMNAKSIRHASEQSLDALRKMRELLTPQLQNKIDDVLRERAGINADFELGKFHGNRIHHARRVLEAQERMIRREFAFKDVYQQLQETAQASADPQ